VKSILVSGKEEGVQDITLLGAISIGIMKKFRSAHQSVVAFLRQGPCHQGQYYFLKDLIILSLFMLSF
jgi:hypothetical protein